MHRALVVLNRSSSVGSLVLAECFGQQLEICIL
jgi:hypothetical protein